MALGGGTFVSQNKILPGSYINFISAARSSSALSDRGVAAMGLDLDWGVEGEVFEVTQEAFQMKTLEIFGYNFGHANLKGLRDLFKNIQTLYVYRLNPDNVKAENTHAVAKHGGARGNDLKIIITANTEGGFTVKTVLDTSIVDEQTVATAKDLVSNSFVTFKEAALAEQTAGLPLSGGSTGTINGEAHQAALDKLEAYSFNVLGLLSDTEEIKQLYVQYTKRLRDVIGQKFQTVLFDYTADYEGVVNVKNDVNLVYWVTGAIAGCEVNRSNLNKLYDGEFDIEADYTQAQLEEMITQGKFALHKVGSELRVLSDINSFTTTTSDKGEIFKDNQTIRVMDQIANDIAVLFNTKYIGKIPNDESGRISLWSDIVRHHENLEVIGAIENFSDADVVVLQGENKRSVEVSDSITVINAMAQLYMTVVIG